MYRNHTGIIVIQRFSQCFSSFYFVRIDKNTALKKIKRLRAKKAIRDINIPIKVLKENADFFCRTNMSSVQGNHLFFANSCNCHICKCNTSLQTRLKKSKR